MQPAVPRERWMMPIASYSEEGMATIYDMPSSEYDAMVEISELCELGVRVGCAVVRPSIVLVVGP